RAQQRVVEGRLVDIGVLRVARRQTQLVLHVEQPAAGTALDVRGGVRQRVIPAKTFAGLPGADPAGHVVLAVDDVVPQRERGGPVTRVAGLRGDVRHRGIGICGTNGVADRLVLLRHRDVRLVVFAPAGSAIEQELRQVDVLLPGAGALGVVDEPAQPYQ